MFKKTCLISLLLSVIFLCSFVKAQEYIVIGWNDLGMHCSNKDFSSIVILPPYNNIIAQVIKKGDSTHLPQVVTNSLYITYEIPGNSYSIGKTNFWSYEDLLFGITLLNDIGLTGAGLTGTMEVVGSHFTVEGVPLTPYIDADLIHEDPFQLGLLKVYDQSNNLLASTQPVIPVSNEINCVSSGCHSSEQNILNEHSDDGGFNPNNLPILCASCHASNALGMAGNPNLPSLSEAIHKKHGDKTNDCYKCHPGPNTQCNRGVMKAEHGFICQDCHGSVNNVGESISNGREPWFEEPSCGAPQCHGSQYAEEPGKLYRQSKGHGGLFCSACHGEPHAILPSENARDNVQNIALQGYAGTLNKCEVCHGITPSGAGPHGITIDECCLGIRGNVDNDPEQMIDISDLVYLVDFIFTNGQVPFCQAEANINGDAAGLIDISDLVYLVDFMFTGGPAPISCF